MKLSVIVPVHNVEKFLPRCLDSLLRQGMEAGEWEVICVNDGSSDNSGAILAEYERKHPEVFRVITQENQGVGAARNVGMKVARGEWIAFVDSDDYVVDGGYRYLLEQFCEEGVVVLQFSCKLVYTDGTSLHDPDAKPDGEITFDGDGAEIYNQYSLAYVWTKFYRRAFMEEYGILFEPVFIEDELFNFSVFTHSPHLRIVTSRIYRYEQGNVHSILRGTEKEEAKRQLRSLIPAIEKTGRYLQQGDGTLIPAAKRGVDMYLRYYYNKMLKANFSRQEWKECVRALDGMPIRKVDPSQESSRLGKAIAHLKNWSATSYPAYLFIAGLMSTFIRLIRPRIISSYPG